MTDEPKRRSYAVDDVETISRRMKEIAAEREAARDDLPSDTEPSAWTCVQPGTPMQIEAASIYSDTYWQPLIDAGILSMEPGDA